MEPKRKTPAAMIGPIQLLTAAVRLMRARARETGLLILTGSGVSFAIQLVLGADAPAKDLAGAARQVVSGTVWTVPLALVGAVALRRFAGAQTLAFRLDAGLAGYVALVAFVTGASLALMQVMQRATATPEPSAMLASLVLVGVTLMVYGFARLVLWPVAVLLGDPRATPAASWEAMEGAVAGFILAQVILAMAGLLVLVAFAPVTAAEPAGPPPVALFAVVSVLSGVQVVISAAFAAVLYRVRMRGEGTGS